MDNDNYPLGSDTPEAPWNQSNEPMKECPECEGTAKQICCDCIEGEVSDGVKCLYCSGVGKVNCPDCYSTGKIPMTVDDIQDEIDHRKELDEDDNR